MSKELDATPPQTAATAAAPDGAPTLYSRVEAILDEESAWIARPNRTVATRIALAAALEAQARFDERAVLENAISNMGWPEIDAFNAERRKGQSIFEDAGGYMLRCIRRLFGLPEKDEEVINYQQAAQRMVDEYLGANAEVAQRAGSGAAVAPDSIRGVSDE